jgi:cellulose synthase/poly-beta-1,6-N-acetylglucosamine synthase-like glycosyltransferase
VYGVGAFDAGANMAFRRTALEKIGGFDVALGAGTPARGGEDLAALISVLWAGFRWVTSQPPLFITGIVASTKSSSTSLMATVSDSRP